MTFTTTLLVPTVGILICRDLPTLDEILVVPLLRVTFVRFFVENVVAK